LSDKLSSKYSLKLQTRSHENESENLYSLEITGSTDWSKFLDNTDVVVHLAASAHGKSNDSNLINEVNVAGTIRLAEQAVDMGVKRFIFISSIGVTGNSTEGSQAFNEESAEQPHSEYSSSKLEAERALQKIAENSELELVIIRPVLVYGRGAPGNFKSLVKLVNYTRLLPFRTCDNQRSFLSIYNLIDFINVCISHPKAANQVFCVSDGSDVSIREFTDAIAQGLSKKIIQLPIPIYFFRTLGKVFKKDRMVEQLVGTLKVDSAKANELLDWKPPYSMEKTLKGLK
jgi:nucleoside-diphosphate-sugar epimerase